MAINRLISRLDGVKQTGPQRYLARCPAHDDKRPSLSITETDDGTLLVKCWAGCTALEVVNAIGLELKDLFPASAKQHHKASLRPGERWIPRDVLNAIAHEVVVVMIAAERQLQGNRLSDEDQSRLQLASKRIHAAVQEVNYGR